MQVGEGLLQVQPPSLEQSPLAGVVSLPIARMEEGRRAILGEERLHVP